MHLRVPLALILLVTLVGAAAAAPEKPNTGAPPAPTWQWPTRPQPTRQQPTGQKPNGQQPTGQQPWWQQPYLQQPYLQQPYGQQPYWQQPNWQQPTGQQPTGQQPTGQQPTGQQPNGQQPNWQQPNWQQPTGQQPNWQQPNGQQPNGQQPTWQQPTGQQPTGQQPTGQQPTGQQPTGQQPNWQQPNGQQPNGQQPNGQQPTWQQPTWQQPNGQQPNGQQPNAFEGRPLDPNAPIVPETPRQDYEVNPPPVFGFDFFAGAPASFEVAAQRPVPADYKLDSGDQLRIRYWTPVLPEVTVDVTLGPAGLISLVGFVDTPASGLTLQELQRRLLSRLGEKLRNPQCVVDLVGPRTFSVFVTGAANRPGRYTVSALSRLFNVVYAAGGPSAVGSMRAVSLLRDGKLVTKMDLYRFLLEGARDGDVALQDQDVIYFPVSGPKVSVIGEVQRVAQYEITPELRIADALTLAGGLLSTGYAPIVRMVRVEDGHRVERTLDAQGLKADDKGPGNPLLLNGDLIEVPTVYSTVAGRVTIEGQVEHEGSFSLQRTPSAKVLLALGQPAVGAYPQRADVIRTLQDGTKIVIPLPWKQILDGTAPDVALADRDTLVLYNLDEKALTPLVKIDGPIKHPAAYPWTEGMRLRDLVFAAGGLLPDALKTEARLQRLTPEGRQELVRFGFAEALTEASEGGPLLKPFDELTVFGRDALEARRAWVWVEGAVKTTGEINRLEGMRIRDALLYCGGLLPEAQGVEAHLFRRINPAQFRIIRFSPQKVLANDPTENQLLEDEDRITIYTERETHYRREFVQVAGAVQRPGEFLHHEGLTLRDLLIQAGGPTDMAWETVEMALPAAVETESELARVESYSLAKLLAGELDQIVVPSGALVSVPTRSDKVAKIQSVRIDGEVLHPGTYALLHKGESLASVLKRAGGFTTSADPFALALTRKREELLSGATADQVKVLMEALDQLAPPLAAPTAAAAAAAGDGKNDDGVATVATQQKQSVTTTAVSQTVLFVSPRRLTDIPIGQRIRYSLEALDPYLARQGEIRLVDGDYINIPERSQVVHVLGAVQSPGPVLFTQQHRVGDYVSDAGGLARDADMAHALMVRVSGVSMPADKVREVMPGDVLVVPSSHQVIQTEKRGSVLSEILSSLLGGAVLFRALK